MRAQGLGRLIAMSLLLCGGGCDRYLFRTHGTIASDGGAVGAWKSAPQGCARGGFVQEGSGPAGRVPSVVTFLWEDPSLHNAQYHDHALEHAPDLPRRLDLIEQEGDGLQAVLTTVKTSGTVLDGSSCQELRLQTREGKRVVPEGRPTLAGRLEMDCRRNGSHVTADLQFERCEW